MECSSVCYGKKNAGVLPTDNLLVNSFGNSDRYYRQIIDQYVIAGSMQEFY